MAIGARNVRACERETTHWIAETERQLETVMGAFVRMRIRPHHLAQRDQGVTIDERMPNADAKAFGWIANEPTQPPVPLRTPPIRGPSSAIRQIRFEVGAGLRPFAPRRTLRHRHDLVAAPRW